MEGRGETVSAEATRGPTHPNTTKANDPLHERRSAYTFGFFFFLKKKKKKQKKTDFQDLLPVTLLFITSSVGSIQLFFKPT